MFQWTFVVVGAVVDVVVVVVVDADAEVIRDPMNKNYHYVDLKVLLEII